MDIFAILADELVLKSFLLAFLGLRALHKARKFLSH